MPSAGKTSNWPTFQLPPTRYILARLCLIPLSLFAGAGFVLSIVAIPLSAGHPSFTAVEAVNLVILLFVTLWGVVQSATISHRDSFVHETRVWTWTLGIGFLIHIIIFAVWLVVTAPTRYCPPLPLCEYTLGGICSPDDLAIYNQLLMCQVNWGLFGANLGALIMEFLAILVVGIMRVIPAYQSPEQGIWYGSIYATWDVQWHFEPIAQLKQLNIFHRGDRQRPAQQPAVRVTAETAYMSDASVPATPTTFASDKANWIRMGPFSRQSR